MCYHVLNRGNARAEVFHKQEDYAAFVRLFPLGVERLPMRVVSFCLLPNHFHLVLWPREDGDSRHIGLDLTHRLQDTVDHPWPPERNGEI
jgi:putative transposase